MTESNSWVLELAESKGEQPVPGDHDRKHLIPKFLENVPYFYAAGSHSSEVRRFFVLPDSFELYHFRAVSRRNNKSCRMMNRGKVTVGFLKKYAQRGELLSFMNIPDFDRLDYICWTNIFDRKFSIHGRNSVFFGGRDDLPDFSFCNCVFGYKPDCAQLRLDYLILKKTEFL